MIVGDTASLQGFLAPLERLRWLPLPVYAPGLSVPKSVWVCDGLGVDAVLDMLRHDGQREVCTWYVGVYD